MTLATFFQLRLGPSAGRPVPAEARRFRLPRADSFFWVFFGALLLRGLYLAEAFRGNELIAHPVVDEQVYVDWAREILGGKWLWSEAINYTPGHPLWLAGWLAVFGWKPVAHFAVFLLLGAGQAVIVGRTAELLWDRRAGLVTGWLAATYWPLIIFEASWFAEPFAILNLSIALFLVLRWSRERGSIRPLFWAGFCLGWSILARANAMLCAPVLAGWIAWECLRAPANARVRRILAAGPAFLLPIALLLAPVLFWNWKISGRPMLRTDGWLSIYAGNDPDLHARAVPVGVRWKDFVYRPVRAGFTDANSKETFWRDETQRVIRERSGEWLGLMGRKAMMLTGSFEVSQEIDIGVFRSASRVLSWPLWPGWGIVTPLALCGLLAMLRSPSARRGWPLALCAAAYFASIVPVQAAARYRLPAVIPLLPLAGWAVIAFVDALRRRDRRVLIGMSATIGAAGLLIWPDWLRLSDEKIVNHWFLIGQKRASHGDDTGAFTAFEEGAAWNPLDPDCPLRMGDIARRRGDIARAEQLFAKALANLPACHDAVLGLGECALASGRPRHALQRVGEALRIAPNNLEALDLASRSFQALGDWTAMARTCAQMRSYLAHPASVAFSEAWAWTLASQPAEALSLFDAIAATPRFATAERQRAAFLGGALAWRQTRDRREALRRWQTIADSDPGFFHHLAAMLTGKLAPDAALVSLPAELTSRSTPYLLYSRGLTAGLNGDAAGARARFEELLAARNARELPLAERDLLEIWASQDLEASSREIFRRNFRRAVNRVSRVRARRVRDRPRCNARRQLAPLRRIHADGAPGLVSIGCNVQLREARARFRTRRPSPVLAPEPRVFARRAGGRSAPILA